MAETHPEALVGGEAAHGLEQQLIHALVECLSTGSADEVTPATRRHRDIVARFEGLLQTQPERNLRIGEVCAALGVSARSLLVCCEEQLGMGPAEYARRGRMQLVHHTLCRGGPDAVSISEVVRRHGFRGLGHFAANYRALFGELPSATLRRGSGRKMATLTLRGRRGRV